MYRELTLSPAEAAEKLDNAGFKIGYEKLRRALIQGKVPFGFAIETDRGGHDFIIFKRDLDDFIQAHGGEI